MVKTPAFRDLISTVAPIVPIDHAPLLGEIKSPRLIYNKQKRQVVCDLSAKNPKNKRLEKIYHKLLKTFNSYDLLHLSSIERMQLETLKGIITKQTEAYKEKHEGCLAKIKLLFRGWFNGGHVDDLNQALLLKLDSLIMLTPPPKKDLDEAQLEPSIENKMSEFLKTEDHFCKAMAAAGENLQLLLDLSQTPDITCSLELIRESNSEKSIEDCKAVFDNLYLEALELKQLFEDALSGPDITTRSKRLADIFSTEKYADYVKTNTKAAEYYLPLMNFITDLINKNQLAESMMVGLNMHGQAKENPDFPLSWNIKLKNTITYCFAPAMQHVMRYELLMKELEELVPYDAPQYNNIIQGLLEAKRNAGTMNLG